MVVKTVHVNRHQAQQAADEIFVCGLQRFRRSRSMQTAATSIRRAHRVCWMRKSWLPVCS